MEQIDTQQAYELIRAHFAPESARLGRTTDEAGCVYRGEDGRKCAVGCLIDDEIFARPPVYAFRRIEDGFTADGAPWATLADELNACGGLNNVKDYIFMSVPELKALLNGEDAEGNRKYQFLRSAQGAHDTAVGTSEFITRLDMIAAEFELAVVKDEQTSELPYVVVDTKNVQPGEQTPVLGRFATEDEAATFIDTLPECESGRYGLDGPVSDSP